MLISGGLLALVAGAVLASGVEADYTRDMAAGMKARPVFERASGARYQFRGIMGERIDAGVRNWLLRAAESNPGMLEMFYDRDRLPWRDLVWHSGEFAGKHLTSAVQTYRITRDPKLRASIEKFVPQFIGGQDSDGYLGIFPRSGRFFPPKDMVDKAGHIYEIYYFDVWGHYHSILGLLEWYLESGDKDALAAARKSADLIISIFGEGKRRLVETGSPAFNQAIAHANALLYEVTKEPRYLAMLHEVEKQWEDDLCGDYVRIALAGKGASQIPALARWEHLHGIQAVAELYFITGDEKYRRAYEQLWWSIVERDRHNNGAFSTDEIAVGNPYAQGRIETCCSVAWIALTVDMLRMTGDSRAADELEFTTLNEILAAQNASGSWSTYNTPQDGVRWASGIEIGWQGRPGLPEINCCSVNAPRALGMLSDWAVMRSEDGVVLNYYGPSTLSIPAPSGKMLSLKQETDYPVGGKVRVTVSPQSAEEFALRLRMPGWSRSTQVSLNGKTVDGVKAGSYLLIKRKWKAGDVIALSFDMSPRLWVGEKECEGKVSVYLGPVLLAYDPRFDVYDSANPLPELDVTKPPVRVGKWSREPRPLVLARFATRDGKGITLCDFMSAGAAGNKYFSWLPARGMSPVAFSRENPMRISWP